MLWPLDCFSGWSPQFCAVIGFLAPTLGAVRAGRGIRNEHLSEGLDSASLRGTHRAHLGDHRVRERAVLPAPRRGVRRTEKLGESGQAGSSHTCPFCPQNGALNHGEASGLRGPFPRAHAPLHCSLGTLLPLGLHSSEGEESGSLMCWVVPWQDTPGLCQQPPTTFLPFGHPCLRHMRISLY